MTTVVVSQPMLFPWVGLFEQISLADVYVHYDDVQFSKGSFTNRVQVRGDDGVRWMTIPVRTSGTSLSIVQLPADDERPWRSDHQDLLARTYAGHPHLGEVLELVAAVYAGDRPFVEVVIASVEQLAAALPITSLPQFFRSSEIGVAGRGSQRVLDVVRHFGGTRYVTGHGARKYLDHVLFEEAGIEVRYMDYSCPRYPVHAGAYTPFVSALDRIANIGAGAGPEISGRAIDWRTFLADPVLSPRSVRPQSG